MNTERREQDQNASDDAAQKRSAEKNLDRDGGERQPTDQKPNSNEKASS